MFPKKNLHTAKIYAKVTRQTISQVYIGNAHSSRMITNNTGFITGGFFMPKTKFQNVVFTAIMAFVIPSILFFNKPYHLLGNLPVLPNRRRPLCSHPLVSARCQVLDNIFHKFLF